MRCDETLMGLDVPQQACPFHLRWLCKYSIHVGLQQPQGTVPGDKKKIIEVSEGVERWEGQPHQEHHCFGPCLLGNVRHHHITTVFM